MIVCPNCSHQNPDGAIQCEACYTPLPSMVSCSTCGASVQSDASFCGQCGANLSVNTSPAGLTPELNPLVGAVADPAPPDSPESVSGDLDSIDIPDVTVPDLVEFDPLLSPEPLTAEIPDLNPSAPEAETPITHDNIGIESPASLSSVPSPSAPDISPEGHGAPSSPSEEMASSQAAATSQPAFKSTQIQTQSIQLLHAHSNTVVEIPPHLNLIHIGKPNDRVPPDIDVSGFKDSEVVSRVHADIRVEGDSYYIEDMGSSNGTYINNIPLAPGNRHKLRSGDRIALGKGDKVSFIIQLS